MLRRLFGCGASASAAVDGGDDEEEHPAAAAVSRRMYLNSDGTQSSSETNMSDNDTLELRVPPLPPSYRLRQVIRGADHSEDDR